MLTELCRTFANCFIAIWLALRTYRFKTLVRIILVPIGIPMAWFVVTSVNQVYFPQTYASIWNAEGIKTTDNSAACAHFPVSFECEVLEPGLCIEKWCEDPHQLLLLSRRRAIATQVTLLELWFNGNATTKDTTQKSATDGHYGPVYAKGEPMKPPSAPWDLASKRMHVTNMTFLECANECLNFNETSYAPASELVVVYALAVIVPVLVLVQIPALFLTLHVHIMDRASLMKVGGGDAEKGKPLAAAARRKAKRDGREIKKEIQLIQPCLGACAREVAAWFRDIDAYPRTEEHQLTEEDMEEVKQFRQPPPRDPYSPIAEEISILDALDKKFQ